MITIDGRRIFMGDFHTHWYWDKENPTVYLAGMDALGMDFVILQDGVERARQCDRVARRYHGSFHFWPGHEAGSTKLHIATWIYPEKPLEDSEMRREGATTEELLTYLKSRCRLVAFAHPGKNWSAAWDGSSYRPLAELYRAGLIDALQTQDHSIREDVRKLGVEVPIVAGFDVHKAKGPEPLPELIFREGFSTFDLIDVCCYSATLVFADELTEDAVSDAVKAGRSVAFDFQTEKFYGPAELVKCLEEGDYVGRLRRRRSSYENVRLHASRCLVGEPFEIEVAERSSRALWPGDALQRLFGEAVEINADSAENIELCLPARAIDEVRVVRANKALVESFPSLLPRNDYYFPVGVRTALDAFVYGVLTHEPIALAVDELVAREGAGFAFFVECALENLSDKSKEVSLELSGDFAAESPEAVLSMKPRSRATHRFRVRPAREPGREYPSKLAYHFDGRSLEWSGLLSWLASARLGKGENPWTLERSLPAILDEVFQVFGKQDAWKGPEDVSARVATRWDDDFFYLYAEVIDDVHYQAWTDWETFWGDSIQFALETKKKLVRGYGTNYEFCLSKTARGDELFIWYSPATGEEQIRRFFPEGELSIERDENSKHTRYKLRIAWKDLAPFKPSAGARFYLCLLVNDSDGGSFGRIMLTHGGNIAECKDTSKAHAVTLLE